MNPSNVRVSLIVWIALLFGALVSPAKAQTWTPTGNLNVPRLGPATALLTDGRVLLVGGENDANGSGVQLNSAEVYSPSTGTWTLTPNTLIDHTPAVRLTHRRVLACAR